MRKVSTRWKNCSDIKAQHSRHFRGEILSKIETLSLISQPRYQELQDEVNCMNDLKDFKDAESVRSGQSHVTSQPAFFPPFQNPGGNAKAFSGNGEPLKRAAKHLGYAWCIGKRFCKSNGVFFSTLPQELNQWSSNNISEHTSPHVMSESQTPNTVQDQRCQSGPSAGNSFVTSEGRFSKNYGADKQRLQISDPHFDK